jgi:hypothetical protein
MNGETLRVLLLIVFVFLIDLIVLIVDVDIGAISSGGRMEGSVVPLLDVILRRNVFVVLGRLVMSL